MTHRLPWFRNQKRPGAIALIAIIVISAFALAVMTTASFTATRGLGAISTSSAGERTFAAAETGIRDALYRIGGNGATGNYSTVVNGININITIDPTQFSRHITSQATDPATNTVRTISIDATASSFGGGFSGAVQSASELIVDPSATINGDVHVGTAGGGTITSKNNSTTLFNGNVWVSGGAGLANGLRLSANKNLSAHTIKDSQVGDAYYQALQNPAVTANNGSETCTAGGGTRCHVVSTDPPPENYPISNSDIQNLATQIANTSNVISTCDGSGNYTVSDSVPLPTIPTKITCNLVVNGGNNTSVTLGANLWVTGNITFSGNNQSFWLPASAPGESKFIISGDPFTPTAAGSVNVPNNVAIKGSDHGNPLNPKDFIFFISMSTNNTLPPPAGALSYAIQGSNNAQAAVYYAPLGLVELAAGVNLNNATGFRVHLNGNAVLNYTSGLGQFFFSPNQKTPPSVIPNSWQEL